MKKIFRIGAAVLSAAAFVTSTGITTLADGEGTTTAANPSLYMYEDFETVQLADDFAREGDRGNLYDYKVVSHTKQYVYGSRDANPTFGLNTKADGNRTFDVKLEGSNGFGNGGSFGRAYLRFDKEGENFKSWVIDKTSAERFVASYDVTINSVENTIADNLPFHGGFMGLSAADSNAYSPMENIKSRVGFQIILDGDTHTYKWSFRDGNSDNQDAVTNKNIQTESFAPGTTTRVTVSTAGYASTGEIWYKFRLYLPDGTTKVYTGLQGSLYSYNGLLFSCFQGMDWSIDNVKAYNLPEGYTFGTTTTDKTNVTRDSSFDIELNGYVSDSELKKIVVKQGDTVIPAENYKITATESKTSVGTTVKIKLNEKPGYSQTYSVTLPTGFANEAGVAVAEEKSVSFTTEAGPSFNITLAAATKDGEITSISDAAGKSVSCTVGVTLNQDANSSGTIFVGLYDADDKLVEYGSMDRAFAAHSTATLKTAFDVPANATGYKIKAFACESLSKLDSFAAPIVIQ